MYCSVKQDQDFAGYLCIISMAGNTITRVLEVLDTLDRHNFDKEDTLNSLETLYHKIFTANQTKDNSEVRPTDITC